MYCAALDLVSLDLEELGDASSSSGAAWSGSTSAAAESMTLLAPGGELGPDVDGCGVAVAPSLPSGGAVARVTSVARLFIISRLTVGVC